MLFNVFVVIALVVGSCIFLGSLYAVVFRFVSKPMAGSMATWNSAFNAGIVGVLAFLAAMFVGVGVLYSAQLYVQTLPYPSLIMRYVGVLVFALAVVAQLFVTRSLLRTEGNQRLNLVNSAKVLAIPVALLVVYSVMTYTPRPDILPI